MSPGEPFDLEPEREEPPLDWTDSQTSNRVEESRMPPVRPGLRRTLPVYGIGRGAARSSRVTGWTRYLLWPVSPTFYYVVGLLSALGMLFIFFNPAFGSRADAWWFDVVRASAPLPWRGEFAGVATTLVLSIVGATVGLWLGRWRYRPAFMALVFAVPMLSPPWNQRALLGNYWVLGVALVGGVLLSAARRRRRGHLFAACLLLAGLLFVPWGGAVSKDNAGIGFVPWSYGNAVADEDPESLAYKSLATEALASIRSPEPAPERTLFQSTHAPEFGILGLGMLALGLLAWMGLGGAWVRWAAGALLLGTYAWMTAAVVASGWDGWQGGAQAWADAFHGSSIAFLLPLAAAVSELREPDEA